MKNSKYKIKSAGLVMLSCLALFYSCNVEDEVFERTRLFQPVLNEDLYAEDNTIIVDLGKMKSAVSYTIEVSRDTFKTDPIISMEVDTNFVVIPDLLWNAIYQVRAKAHADDPQFDSKGSDENGMTFLGNVRTERYPSILNLPGENDYTDTRAKLTWVTAGAPVTSVKVFAGNDERLENPLEEIEITDEEIAEGIKIVDGLDPATTYQIALYSGEELRGWVDYTTRVALPEGIDLSGLPGTSLMDTLPDIQEGDIIILENGVVYPTDGYLFDKSVTIMGGYGFSPEPAIIEFGLHKGFDVVDGVSIDHLVFKGIAIKGPFDGSFMFYLKNGGTIGEIKYEDCKIGPLRGGMRIHSGDGHIDKFTVNNCVVDSIKDYSFFQINGPDWSVGDILIQNSTFSFVGSSFIRSNSTDNANSITIESCTFMRTTHTGRSIFDWGTDGSEVSNGIKIYNSIWGPGWHTDGGEDVSVKGYSRLAATNFDIINNWVTSDFLFSGSEIPEFASSTYNKPATELWVDPLNGDFNIKDSGFEGKNDAGDPRWRPGI